MTQALTPFTVNRELAELADRGCRAALMTPLERLLALSERLGLAFPWDVFHRVVVVGLVLDGRGDEAKAFARAADLPMAEAPAEAPFAPRVRDHAETVLRAAEYPEARHDFRFWRCECGNGPVGVFVRHQRGSAVRDFAGEIHATCARCAREWIGLGRVRRDPVVPVAEWPRTLPPAEVDREERPACRCGHATFHVATCDRIERGGFFDEGVVVAGCAGCGEPRTLAAYD